MSGRIQTFPYEILRIWQQIHGPLSQEHASTFIKHPTVLELGAFDKWSVRNALEQTPKLSNALAIAQAAQAKSNSITFQTPLESQQQTREFDAEARAKKVKKGQNSWRLSANGRWRPGNIFIRRAQVWADMQRENPTPAENRLEAILRAMLPGKGAVQVQWIFGKTASPYILDFFIPHVRLGIEVDGTIHTLPWIKSRDRDKALMAESIGVTLRRFTNEQVLTGTDQDLTETVKRWCDQAAER